MNNTCLQRYKIKGRNASLFAENFVAYKIYIRNISNLNEFCHACKQCSLKSQNVALSVLKSITFFKIFTGRFEVVTSKICAKQANP